MIAEENLDFEDGNGDAPDGEAEFDQGMLDMLNEDLGAETFVFLLGKCAEDIRFRLEKLSALPSLADLTPVRALAHQLKGVFLQFGANAARIDAAALETAEPGNVAERLERLRASATRALDHFERLSKPV